MNQTSSIQTGAITLTAASLVPIIDWAATALHIAIPVDAQLQLAAMLITGGHALYNCLLARAKAKDQGRLINVQTFRASGTYTPTVGAQMAKVEPADDAQAGASVQ